MILKTNPALATSPPFLTLHWSGINSNSHVPSNTLGCVPPSNVLARQWAYRTFSSRSRRSSLTLVAGNGKEFQRVPTYRLRTGDEPVRQPTQWREL